MKDKLRYATEEEKLIFRQGVGQLGWLTNVRKPESAFMFCSLITVQSKPQILDFHKYRKSK